jgi:hypothetical protein
MKRSARELECRQQQRESVTSLDEQGPGLRISEIELRLAVRTGKCRLRQGIILTYLVLHAVLELKHTKHIDGAQVGLHKVSVDGGYILLGRDWG